MKKTGIILFSALSILFFSCGTGGHTEEVHSESAIHEEHDTHGAHTTAEAEVIELDNGQKWKVNDEMKPYLNNGITLVNSYKKQDDHAILAEQLKEQNDLLIKSCTMDGKSHDELHKWLHPHLELVKDLKNAKSGEEADPIVVKLKDSYKVYEEHFQ